MHSRNFRTADASEYAINDAEDERLFYGRPVRCYNAMCGCDDCRDCRPGTWDKTDETNDDEDDQ